MALSGYDLAAASGAPMPFRVAVEVYTDSPSRWCDINKPFRGAAGDDFYNLLIGLPTLKVQSEVVPGRFATSVSSLKLRDDDGIFGKEAENVTLYDLGGTACTIEDWHDKKVRIRIGHHVESTDAWDYDTLGTFKIDRITRDPKTRVATMKLVGLEKELMDASAADVKRGDSWFTNIPIPLLAKELLREGTNDEGDWESNSPPDDCRQDWTEPVLSVLGNMPVLKSSGSHNDHTEVAVLVNHDRCLVLVCTPEMDPVPPLARRTVKPFPHQAYLDVRIGILHGPGFVYRCFVENPNSVELSAPHVCVREAG